MNLWRLKSQARKYSLTLLRPGNGLFQWGLFFDRCGMGERGRGLGGQHPVALGVFNSLLTISLDDFITHFKLFSRGLCHRVDPPSWISRLFYKTPKNRERHAFSFSKKRLNYDFLKFWQSSECWPSCYFHCSSQTLPKIRENEKRTKQTKKRGRNKDVPRPSPPSLFLSLVLFSFARPQLPRAWNSYRKL